MTSIDVRPGDRVRLTIHNAADAGTYSVEGIVWEHDGHLYVEVLERALPPEPPEDSIVLVDGFAWQRKSDWWCVGNDLFHVWAEVCQRGTPQVVWQP